MQNLKTYSHTLHNHRDFKSIHNKPRAMIGVAAAVATAAAFENAYAYTDLW
jgi:hypothetical protein